MPHWVRLWCGLLCCGTLAWDNVVPEHLRHGEVWRRIAEQETGGGRRAASELEVQLQYLTVPLDHEATDGPTWQLKYFVNEGRFVHGGPLVLHMPGEGAVWTCSTTALGNSLKALQVCPQHRFFGDSVPNNDSSTAKLRYLTVEQNLADIAALIKALRKLYPSVSKVVAYGGSYSGASASWIRRRYPEVVDAAIAQSPPVTAKLGFPEYDVSLLVALSSPDSRCAQVVASTNLALERLFDRDREALMHSFKAGHYISAGMGDVDFAYALGDSVAAAVQYGQKNMLCEVMVPLFSEKDTLTDWDYAEVFANFTSKAWGPDYFAECWYNSTSMQHGVSGTTAEDARAWYWLICTQLGYLQTAPREGLRARNSNLTVERLLDQCRYIYGPEVELLTEEKVQAFNERFGGGSDLGASHIFETAYSDDPWKQASTASLVARTSWPLAIFEQPFFLLTCDGCGHCGSGVPEVTRDLITEQFVGAQWSIAGVFLAFPLMLVCGCGAGPCAGFVQGRREAEAAEKEEGDGVAHLQGEMQPMAL